MTVFLDFLKDPLGDRSPNWNTTLGTCPVKFMGEEGWVKTGDAGGTDLSSESLRSELPAAEKVVKGTEANDLRSRPERDPWA